MTHYQLARDDGRCGYQFADDNVCCLAAIGHSGGIHEPVKQETALELLDGLAKMVDSCPESCGCKDKCLAEIEVVPRLRTALQADADKLIALEKLVREAAPIIEASGGDYIPPSVNRWLADYESIKEKP